MKLEAFQDILPLRQADWGGIEIAGITSDSRKVDAGFLFAALPGNRADGTAYIGEAIGRGAAAILLEGPGGKHGSGVPLIGAGNARRALALAAARFCGTQPRIMAAVTGTAGKTSVASFTRQFWSHA